MKLEDIQLFLPFLAPALGLLCTTIVFLKKFVKNKRLKKVLEKAEKLTKEIIPCIMEAEKFVNYTGEEKKNFVMTKLNQFAIINNIKFNEEETSNKIEQLVSLTKEVNVNNNSNYINNVKIQEEIKKDSIEQQIQNIIAGLAR